MSKRSKVRGANLNSLPEALVRNMHKYLSTDEKFNYSLVNRQAKSDTEYFLTNINDADFLIKEITRKCRDIFPALEKDLVDDSYYQLDHYQMEYNTVNHYLSFSLDDEIVEQSEDRFGFPQIEFQSLAYNLKSKYLNFVRFIETDDDVEPFEMSEQEVINEDKELDFYFRALKRQAEETNSLNVIYHLD